MATTLRRKKSNTVNPVRMSAATNRTTSKAKTASQRIFWPYGLILFTVLLIIDQYTKHVVNAWSLGATQKITPGLWFTYVQNTGAVWSTFPDSNAMLMWLSIIAFGVLMYFFDHFKTTMEKIAYTLLLTGLWGNLLDRALFGFVIDFIDVHWWPIFNVADSCIVVGVTIFLLEQWRISKKPSTD